MNVLRPSMVKTTLAYLNEHNLEMPTDKQECIKKALERSMPKLVSVISYSGESKYFCPACSEKTDRNDNYCSHCGQRLKREDGNTYVR